MDLSTLTLTLKPHWENGTVAWTHMDFSFPADALGEAPEIRYPDKGFGGLIPFPEYDAFYVTDSEGALPYELVDSPNPLGNGAVPYKDINFKRAARGTVRWGYRALPRVLPENYRSSPYFDFRSEPGGMNGIGFFSFMLPKAGTRFHASVHWDMSEMPAGARGVFWRAVGDFELDTDTMEFMMGYYAAGLMNAVEDENFGVYWFGETDFDAKALAGKLSDLFHTYARFFHDENAVYRIFLRRDPFEVSGGGTAGTRSFLSGYSAISGVDMDRWYSTLAHEILHNWPDMEDERNYGEGTWYNEGCAEYFSTILPLRAGLTTPEYAAGQINDKVASRYLDNPYREVPNMGIAEVQWKDRRAQTIPYGRGCLYLANTDAELKRFCRGSIDDFVSIHNKLSPVTPEDWTAFIRERLGEDGIQKFEDMKAGKLFAPDPDAFDGRFDCREVDIEIDGKACKSYRWTVRSE